MRSAVERGRPTKFRAWGLVDWWRPDMGITVNDASLTFPNDFDNAAWTKNASSISANATADPFGGSLADRLVEDNTNTFHYVSQSASNLVAGPVATYSIYAKANTRSWLIIAANGLGTSRYFDLQNGALGSRGGTEVSSTITAMGNGWYLCTMTFTVASALAAFFITSGNGVASYTGDGSSSIYIYGASASQPKVSAWIGQGAGNNLAQGTAASQGLWVPSGTPNGRPTVRFDGVDDFAANGALSIPQPSTSMSVMKATPQTAASTHDTLWDQNPGKLTDDTTPQTIANQGAAITYAGAVANGAFARIEALLNGASSELRENDTVRASGNAGASSGTGLTLGALAGGTRSATVEFAEHVIYTANVPASPLARIRNYFKGRYSLT